LRLWRWYSLSIVSWIHITLIKAPAYKFAAAAKNASTASVVDVVVTTTEVFSNIYGAGSLTFTETYTSISTSIVPTPGCYTGIGACGSQLPSPTPESTTSGGNPVIKTLSATDMSTASPIVLFLLQPLDLPQHLLSLFLPKASLGATGERVQS
jgi:hypothetical protein